MYFDPPRSQIFKLNIQITQWIFNQNRKYFNPLVRGWVLCDWWKNYRLKKSLWTVLLEYWPTVLWNSLLFHLHLAPHITVLYVPPVFSNAREFSGESEHLSTHSLSSLSESHHYIPRRGREGGNTAQTERFHFYKGGGRVT